jgi:hypothetical protein
MKKLSVLALAVLFAVSCVSSPEPAPAAPDWVLSPPGPDGTNTYFVGYSSAGSGDVAKATDDASANLVAGIMNYLGTRVTVDSTAEARATLDSYQADIVQTVKSESSGRLSGFSIKERYETKGPNDSITVYILAAYQTRELEREKARIAAVFQEQDDAVAKPEAAGDAAASGGRWFDAVRFYIEAAVAASGVDIDNADIKLERNVNKARAVLSKLRFVRVDAPSAAGLGQPVPQPFQARLVHGEGDSAPAIPGVEVFVAYQSRQASGRVINRTSREMSDQRGMISFTPPPPDFVGKQMVTFTLNLDSARELLDKMPRKYDAYVDALSDDLARRSIVFEYNVASQARTVNTGVAILDLGADGVPAATTVAQGGLMETLVRERFKASVATFDAQLIVSSDDNGILQAARARYGSTMGRIIYGVAVADKTVKDGSMWQATARMTIRCLDLASGNVLYSTEKTAVMVAADENQAKRSALLQVARDTVAKDLMANLP